MITYQKQQNQLFENIEKKFKTGKNPSTIVPFLKNYATDNQICLTSVIFLPKKLQQIIIKDIINPLKKIDQNQYYYTQNSLHITLQPIRIVNNPPSFNNEDIYKADQVFKKIIPKYKSFELDIKGLFELPTSLSIRAYSNKILQKIRLELTNELKNAGVPNNKINASKLIFFGNITICRYTKKPNKEFFNKVKELKNEKIGILNSKTISLITTNTACHPKKTKIINEYRFK